MGTCKQCSMWEKGEGYWCPSDKGYCNQPTGTINGPVQASRGAGGHGEPGDANHLRTGPDFGCINFVPR